MCGGASLIRLRTVSACTMRSLPSPPTLSYLYYYINYRYPPQPLFLPPSSPSDLISSPRPFPTSLLFLRLPLPIPILSSCKISAPLASPLFLSPARRMPACIEMPRFSCCSKTSLPTLLSTTVLASCNCCLLSCLKTVSSLFNLLAVWDLLILPSQPNTEATNDSTRHSKSYAHRFLSPVAKSKFAFICTDNVWNLDVAEAAGELRCTSINLSNSCDLRLATSLSGFPF